MSYSGRSSHRGASGSASHGSGMSKLAIAAGVAAGAAAVGALVYYVTRKPEDEVETQPTVEETQHDTTEADQATAAPVTASASSTSGKDNTGEHDEQNASGKTKDDEEDDNISIPENAHQNVSKSLLIEMLEELVEQSRELMDDIKSKVSDGQLDPQEAAMQGAQKLQQLDAESATKYGISQEEIQSAQQTYMKDHKVKELTKELQSTIASGLQSQMPEPTLGLEEVCDKVRENARITMDLLKEMKDEIIDSGKSGDEAREEFQRIFITKMPEMQQKAMDRLGLSAEEFQSNLTAFMNEPELFKAIQETQQEMENMQRSLLTEW